MIIKYKKPFLSLDMLGDQKMSIHLKNEYFPEKSNKEVKIDTYTCNYIGLCYNHKKMTDIWCLKRPEKK